MHEIYTLYCLFSAAGLLSFIKGNDPKPTELRAKFSSSHSTLTVDELSKLMTDFVEATEAGNWAELGWPSSTYVVSKIGLCALSVIQQREFDADPRKVCIQIEKYRSSYPCPYLTQNGMSNAVRAKYEPHALMNSAAEKLLLSCGSSNVSQF